MITYTNVCDAQITVITKHLIIGLGLWCLTFNNTYAISAYHHYGCVSSNPAHDEAYSRVVVFNFQQYTYILVVSFIGGGNQITWRNADLAQITDKLYHIMLYRVRLIMSRI
jgi:hypothetical protein